MKLIINPFSGQLKKRGRLDIFRKYIKRFLKNAYVELTDGPLHASEIAYKAVKNGFKTIVSVGGDGTFNEVVHGVAGEKVDLGLVPMGSGNDFARSLGLNGNPLETLKNISDYRPKKIDIISLNGGKIATNIVGTGIDSEVVQMLQGTRSYFTGFYRALIRHKTKDYNITLDGKEYFMKDVNVIVVANGNYFGRNMKIAPMAKIDDGLLDIIIIKKLSKFQLFTLFPRVYRGTHIGHPNCFLYHVKKIKIEKDGGFYYERDGELGFSNFLEMSVLYKNISILTPGL
ncbi:diacylglycerol kinase family lipid kinase [bacterium]|nr:diacylglycerol kinase family lipid kinase [bacterium]